MPNLQGLKICVLASMAVSTLASATELKPFYAAADIGIFQGNFNTRYNDVSDAIPQNIAETVQQNSYTGGLAIGYSRPFCEHYALGAELSGNMATNHARYASGAATAAFSDVLQVENWIDLVLVPGILLNDTITAYAKLGLSRAEITSELTSPVGFTPVFTSFNGTRDAIGLAAGLGIRYFVNKTAFIFIEYNYHDYGAVNFSNFQNFTASYNHSERVSTHSIVIGAAYTF